MIIARFSTSKRSLMTGTEQLTHSIELFFPLFRSPLQALSKQALLRVQFHGSMPNQTFDLACNPHNCPFTPGLTQSIKKHGC